MDKEKLMTKFDGQWVPEKLLYVSSDICMGLDCSDCGSVCKKYFRKGCKKCPLQEVFNRLGEYEAAGLMPEQIKADKWKYDGSREESCVSDEILYGAVNTQVEFLRRCRERYDDEPEFDIVILKIMLELKERRAAEGRKSNAEEKEQPETE